MKSLRLAYIAPRWDYGDPRRGFSFEEMNFRSALEGMGHDVHPYDFVDRFKAVGRARMNEELDAFVRDVEPDLSMFVLFKDEIERDVIEGLTRDGITTFNWFTDDHWRFDSFSRHYAPAFTLVSTTDRTALPRYEAIGARAVLTQWACNRYAYAPRAKELRYDVSFVGQRYGDRPKVVKALRKAGIDVYCRGMGWSGGRVDHDEMVEIFGASRVNLNLANSWGGHFWSRHRVVSQIKGRTFEVPGSGGFLLTDHAPHLEEYFEIGAEIDVFESTEHLTERVKYWLEHEEERQAVARAGYERVVAEHTYDRRFAAIFDAAGVLDD